MPDGLMSDAEFLGTGSGSDTAPSAAPKTMTDAEFLGADHAPNGPLSNTGDEGLLSGAAKGLGTVAIKGVGNSVGMVGNTANLADYLFARGHAAISGRPWGDVYGELKQRQAQADQGLGGLVGAARPENVLPSGDDVSKPILKRTGEYVPDTEWGRAGMAGAETAVSMIGPGGGARAIETGAPAAVQGLARNVAEKAIMPAVKAAPATAAGGAAAQTVTDYTGDPLLGMIAGVAVPAVGSTAAAGAKAAIKPFAEDIPIIGRQFAGTREAEVGRQLLASSDNPTAVERTLFPGPMQPDGKLSTEIVPASQPTTGQFTGDRGLLGSEWAARTAKSGKDDVFAGVDADQNAARNSALTSLSPAGADTMRPGQLFQSQLDHIDASTQAAVDRLSQTARDAASPIGNAQPPDVNGAAMRQAVETARGEAKAIRSRLYDAVDPDGSLAIVASPVRAAAEKVAASIDPYGAPLQGDAARILGKMQTLPDVMTFRSLGELEKDVTAAMSAERRSAGETPTLMRLSQLNGAIKDAIGGAVENQAKYEAGAVARGEMEPEAAMAARLRNAWGVANAGSEVAASYRRAGSDVGYVPGSGATGRTSSIGTSDASAGRPSSLAGDQGISPPASLAPNVDAAAAGRLNAAKDAHADYAQTYRQGPVAPTLKTNGFAGQYALPDSAIPSKAFVAGDRGGETIHAFAKAANNDPAALSAIQNYATGTLAKALNPDGTLNPARYERWYGDHAQALRAIDEHSPGFSKRFVTAARASDTLTEALTARKQALDGFQKSEAAKLLGKSSPTEVEDAMGGILATPGRGISDIQGLVRAAGSDPAAVDGLRKAGIDWMVRKFGQSADSGTAGEPVMASAAFRKFVNERYPVLKELYGEEAANTFRALGADLQRANLTATATAPKRGPGTAKDIAPILTKAVETAKNHTSLAHAVFMSAIAGHEAAGFQGAIGGVALGGAGYLLGSLRSAGVRTMDDMFRDALSSPERARHYVAQVPPSRLKWQAEMISKSARREFANSPVTGAEDRKQFRAGGRVEPTDGQKAAGNYAKERISFRGLPITIENAKGSTRSGRDRSGKEWSVRMPAAYGYIRRTEGADGDHVDAYIGPDEKSDRVFVVDQRKTGRPEFDEHKCLLGFRDQTSAVKTYRDGFSDGKSHMRIGSVTAMSVDEFRHWLRTADLSKPCARTFVAHRASGGRVGKPDYPAKRATRLEKDAARHLRDLGTDFIALSHTPDQVVADALRVASRRI